MAECGEGWMNVMMKIAFLEDDANFAEDVVGFLKNLGHEVQHFASGRECLRALAETKFDICLFDWEVPEMSGREVLQNLKLKGSLPPTIFLTARDSEEDLIGVIELGADDYIVKPASLAVLNARINALYRRSNPVRNQEKILDYGRLCIDFSRRKFKLQGEVVSLTEKETELALYFFEQQGVLLSRANLIKVVWGSTPDVDTRTIDVHVSRLRSKLELLPHLGWRLVSVYQQGYRLERLD